MKLGYSLTIEQKQTLAMTPELIQAIQILQFNNQELSDFVQNELLENPVLESEKPQGIEEFDIKDKIMEANYDADSYKQWEYSPNDDDNDFTYEQYVSVKSTLTDYLEEQIQFSKLKNTDLEIANYIVEAIDENGYLTAMKAVVVADTGAYASLGGPVLQRACTHAAGPYNFQTIDIDGTAVYTNNPPAGAFRGFGVTQTCFASEMNLNLLAEMVGITPWEIRHRNAIRPGQVLPNGQIADSSTGVAETLKAVKEICEKEPYVGIACAMKNAGVGVGLPDWGRCRLIIKDGKVEIHAGASCIGQGLGTVLTQMVSQTAELPYDKIIYCSPNTANSPDSGTTSGSRQTLVTGEAARRACLKLKEAMEQKTLEELNGTEYYGEYLAKTDKMGSDVPNPVSHVAYGYATQICVLNEDGTIKKMVAAHDVGKAVNPKSVEGQIEGGVVMSLGYALTEQYEIKEGRPVSRFGTLGLFKADKVPDVEAIIVEKPGIEYAYGAIGIGEITSIPTAPAIAAAYYKLQGEFQTKLPLKNTPYEKKKKK